MNMKSRSMHKFMDPGIHVSNCFRTQMRLEGEITLVCEALNKITPSRTFDIYNVVLLQMLQTAEKGIHQKVDCQS
jgi:hypothetical protein